MHIVCSYPVLTLLQYKFTSHQQVQAARSDNVGMLICMYTHMDMESQLVVGDTHMQSSLGLRASFNASIVNADVVRGRDAF